MDIKEAALKINELASNYKMSNFQDIRKNLKNLDKFGSKNIFSLKTIRVKEAYAFHSGGRNEIQYNIGYETDSKLFRYGLAFSLESSKTLPNPISKLKPKIDRFNKFISNNSIRFYDMYLWYYQDRNRSKNLKIGRIDDHLVQNNTFIFIGKYFEKTIGELDKHDYEEILKTFDRLLEIYQYVENDDVIEERIARICWNENNWQRPSGRDGKSKGANSYECKMGFGHEEWLLDPEKIIDGYHYGYLEQINNHWKRYEGRTFNISLYSINSITKERWWIGRIKNVKIITKDESDKIFVEYKRRGWLKEMIKQLKNVKADTSQFTHSKPYYFFNLKYVPEDIELLDTPLRISKEDKLVRATYYSTLLSKDKEPKLETSIDKRFNFIPGHKPRKKSTNANYGKRESNVDLFHNKMMTNSFNQLVKIYGEYNIGTDQKTESGSEIDLVIKKNNLFIFYEFKTSNSIKICIREALSQLLEYAYYPNQNRASKLIIVSQNKINEEAQEYLKKLRESFNIPVYYKRYNPETYRLEKAEY